MIEKNKDHTKKVIDSNFNMKTPGGIIDSSETNVEKAFAKQKIYFLSEWFFDESIHDFTNFTKKPLEFPLKIPTQYSFPDSDRELRKKAIEFHVSEGLEEGTFKIMETEGSTPMISSLLLFAKKEGFNKIYGITPLYFTIYKICDCLGLEVEECNLDLTYDRCEGLNLPNKKSFLIITDPIWVIGRHHCLDVFKKLKLWQEKTGSIIFVDGSFSYMDWDKEDKKEPSTILNPEKTFRLVCPTKTLGLNGLRYSYLICPNEFSREMNEITCANIGASCFFSNSLRKRMFEEMIKKRTNPIGDFCSKRFGKIEKKLKKHKIPYIKPNCGFFFYADIEDFFKKKGIDKKYFWLNNLAVDIFNKKYEGYAKISLISKKTTFNELLKDLS